jgi:O-antigen ligase
VYVLCPNSLLTTRTGCRFRPTSVFLGGLFLLALLSVFYAAREIVLPIVLAFVLMLVLQPALRMLERLRVPRTLAALLLISLLFGTTSRSRLHCPGQLPPGQRSCPRACHGC